MNDEFQGELGPDNRQILPDVKRRPLLTWALLGVNALVFLAATAAGGTQDDLDVLLDFGAMFGPLIAGGEYWRLFTAMFLHVGLAHLFVNSIMLLIFGQIVERAYGHARFAIIYLLAGLAGSVASFIFNPLVVAAGASGAIFGVVGALAAFFVAQRQILGGFGRQNLAAIVVLMSVQLLYGLATPGIENWAHLGGLIGGFAIGLGLAPRYEILRSPFGATVKVLDTDPLLRRWWVPPVAAAFLVLGFQIGALRVPDNPFTPLVVAQRHYDRSEFRKALAEIDEAIVLDPLFGRSYYLRARVLFELGDLAAARSELGAAIQFGDRETRADAIALLLALNSRRSG